MTTTSQSAGGAFPAVFEPRRRFPVSAPESFERIDRALDALSAISCLMAGGIPSREMGGLMSEELASLLDLVGREIEDANLQAVEDHARKEASNG